MPSWSNDDGSCSWCADGKSPCPAHDKEPMKKKPAPRSRKTPMKVCAPPPPKSSSPKSITVEETDVLLNKVCALHGFRRFKVDPNDPTSQQHVTVGLRGPAGRLAAMLMNVMKHIALHGVLPEAE